MDRRLRKSGTLPQREYNEFTSEVNINSPDGVIRSSDVDRYIESALKPLIEEGKAFKRVSVNRRTGIRSTSYAYQGGKNIQDSVNAVLDSMHEALGYDIDPATGNVKGTGAPPPMAIADRGRRRYNIIEERILDPRAAASIRAQALRAGGVSTTDKASGYTTTLIPAGSGGKTKAILDLVDKTDAKYLSGELPSSALADGASPATIEERAKARILRQGRLKKAEQAAVDDLIRTDPGNPAAVEELARRAKQAERMPGTREFDDRVFRGIEARDAAETAKQTYIALNPLSRIAVEEMDKRKRITDRASKAALLAAERVPGSREFDAKVFRNIRSSEARQEAVQKYIALNPNSLLAVRAREKRSAARGRRAKRFAGNVARISRNALILIVGTILTAITGGVGLLSKAFTVLSQIGTDIRKRALDEARYNFEPGTLEAFHKFAAQRPDIDKNLLIQTAGGFHKAWSTPLNYTEGGFNQLAPYLREGTVKLVSMATASGDKNVFRSMGLIIDDLVDKSLKGIAGAKTFNAKSHEGRHAAYSLNASVLGNHIEGMGQFMDAYWNDFMQQKLASIDEWKVKDMDGNLRKMTFENWITQGAWNPEYAAKTGADIPVARTAADRTNQLLQQFLGTYNNLAHDVGIAFQAQIGGLIEFLRGNLTDWIKDYFPVFALKEDLRAQQINVLSQKFVESVLPGYETEAVKHLRGALYGGSLEEFRPVFEDIKRGKTVSIPDDMDQVKLYEIIPALMNYYKASDYKKKLEDEMARSDADPDYITKAVPVDSASFAVESTFAAAAAQRKMLAGAKHIDEEELPVGARTPASALLSQWITAAKSLPGLIGSAVARYSSAARDSTIEVNEITLAHYLKQLEEWDPSKRRTHGSKEELQRAVETQYRILLKAYQKEGDTKSYKYVLMDLIDHLKGIEMTPEQYEEMNNRPSEFNRRIANLSFLPETYAEEFVKHDMKLTPLEIAHLLEGRLRQIESAEALVAEHGSLEARAGQPSNTGTFAGAITILADIKKVAARDYGLNFDEWFADSLHSVYADVADGVGSNRSATDIIINFIDDRDNTKTFRFPLKNIYHMVKDFHLKDHVNHVELSSSFDAASQTEMEGR